MVVDGGVQVLAAKYEVKETKRQKRNKKDRKTK